MAWKTTIKQKFLSAFRELFIYHHTSLEFRAKLFALLIAATQKSDFDCELEILDVIGMEIYNDKDRADALVVTAKEYVVKIYEKNELDFDSLVDQIRFDLRTVPRYVHKINLTQLKRMCECENDEDTQSFQENILEFFETLKEEHANGN